MTARIPARGPVAAGAATASALAVLAAALSTAPWWIAVSVFVLLAVLGLAHAVFPQASGDRLQWWLARWSHRSSRRRNAAARRRRADPGRDRAAGSGP